MNGRLPIATHACAVGAQHAHTTNIIRPSRYWSLRWRRCVTPMPTPARAPRPLAPGRNVTRDLALLTNVGGPSQRGSHSIRSAAESVAYDSGRDGWAAAEWNVGGMGRAIASKGQLLRPLRISSNQHKNQPSAGEAGANARRPVSSAFSSLPILSAQRLPSEGRPVAVGGW